MTIDLSGLVLDIPETQEERAAQERAALKRIVERSASAPTAYENWAPAVEKAGVKSPETVAVPLSVNLQITYMDGMPMSDESRANIKGIANAVAAMGEKHGFPVFIKTSFSSNKHAWVDSCCVPDATEETVLKHLLEIIDCQAFSPYPISGFVLVREMLKTEAAFVAFGGMPVTQEFRLFTVDGKVDGFQPYWPETSILNPSVEDWKPRLAAISKVSVKDLQHLIAQAEAVTKHLDGDWSVDFLKDKNGDWWLIDMAEASKSFRCQVGYKKVVPERAYEPGSEPAGWHL